MLLLHEVHEVRGREEEAFEAAIRDRYLPALAGGDDARLLYFLHHAHGTGVSYNVVTITALRDAAAWGALVERVHAGDLRAFAEEADHLRHDVTAKILLPLPWSPLFELDFGAVPAEPAEHEPSVFLEDTVWPDEGKLEAYVERSGTHYAVELERAARSRGSLLRIEGAFRTAFGSGRRREVVLWQKLANPTGLAPLVAREVPDEYKRPGTWMHDALDLRDRWESRLLRTSPWSPLW